MNDTDTKSPEQRPASGEPAQVKQKFIDSEPGKTIMLGKIRTDEEARLAAEIEKLRD